MSKQQTIIRVLACPNAFKGSLSAINAARAISEGIARSSRGDAESSTRHYCRFEIDQAPLADGGDGTLETLVAATGGEIFHTHVCGPLGETVSAPWGRLGGSHAGTAVIEMALASGLGLLQKDKYDPINSSTYGTGELMLAAAESGCTKLLVAIGGSATNDGGAGMASALGARLLDKNGRTIPPGGGSLEQITAIDMSGWKLPRGLDVQVACDVDNPLTGLQGASAVYGPQKGATPEMILRLDSSLRRYAEVLAATFGSDVSETPGAGAAGGLGAGLMAFCGALLVPGTELVLEAVGFDQRLAACSMAITGEGQLDGQTARGKVIGTVARRSQVAGKPCVALVGGIKEDADDLLRPIGLTSAFSILDGPMELEAAKLDAFRLLSNAAYRLAKLITVSAMTIPGR